MDRLHRRIEAGFSFVELLVTIIVAGIVFAAMVPVFVQAKQQQSGDAARNLALNIAQDRVEKIRRLAYDDLKLVNLESTTFNAGQFGPTATMTTDSGATRTFDVSYSIDPVPSNAAWGKEDYKKVTVDVSWTGNPQPVKHAILTTFVYKQYAGPQVTQLNVEPLATLDEPDNPLVDPQKLYIAGSEGVALPITVTTTIAGSAVDITWRVKFSVFSSTGVEVASGVVQRDLSDASHPTNQGVYQWVWNASPSTSLTPDGRYMFRVAAQSTNGYVGNTIQQTHDLERGAPPMIEGFVAQAADQKVGLSWTPSPCGDLEHYEIYRRLDGEPYPDNPVRVQPEIGWVDEDPPLVNGTSYWYKIVACDALGHRSVDSPEVGVIPNPVKDTTPPSVPAVLTIEALSGLRQVNITWSACMDLGTTKSGVLGYRVYRSTSPESGYVKIGSGPVTVGNMTAPAFSDTAVDPNTTYYYKISSVDEALNESAMSPAYWVLTANDVYRFTVSMRVQNNSSNVCQVSLVDLDTGTVYGPVTFRKNQTDTGLWTDVPIGNYRTKVVLSSTELDYKSVSFSLSSNYVIQPNPTTVPL
jgi:type II secretory pathway pseudopilin PulG/fibronectin type 3 domain-containing protein